MAVFIHHHLPPPPTTSHIPLLTTSHHLQPPPALTLNATSVEEDDFVNTVLEHQVNRPPVVMRHVIWQVRALTRVDGTTVTSVDCLASGEISTSRTCSSGSLEGLFFVGDVACTAGGEWQVDAWWERRAGLEGSEVEDVLEM